MDRLSTHRSGQYTTANRTLIFRDSIRPEVRGTTVCQNIVSKYPFQRKWNSPVVQYHKVKFSSVSWDGAARCFRWPKRKLMTLIVLLECDKFLCTSLPQMYCLFALSTYLFFVMVPTLCHMGKNNLPLVWQFQRAIVCHQWTNIVEAIKVWPRLKVSVPGKIIVIFAKIKKMSQHLFFSSPLEELFRWFFFYPRTVAAPALE